MEFRSQNHDDLVTTTTTTTTATPSFKPSAFSKPTLSPSSSLLSPRPPQQTSKNGNVFTSNPSPSNSPDSIVEEPPHRYKECLRNHAANIGVHVVDGCGEFMPIPNDPLKCAACSCHRSFHRKEIISRVSEPRGPQLLLPPLRPVAHQESNNFNLTGFPASPMMVFGNVSASGGTTTESSSEERMNVGSGPPRKRFRTKFTPEQKDKMLEFAERIGWRIQKQDEALVERFCAESGVKRQVLKVWMHNNKHVVKRQQQSLSSSATASAMSNMQQHQ